MVGSLEETGGEDHICGGCAASKKIAVWSVELRRVFEALKQFQIRILTITN
jgi:hypothetical protein